MKERVKDTKICTTMTDREIVELTVTDTIRAKMIELEDQLMTLMKEEDTDREEMSLTEDHTETNPETPPEMDQEEEPTETSLGTSLEIDTDREDIQREAAAKKAEKETTGKKKTGSPTMVKGDSERVARSP